VRKAINNVSNSAVGRAAKTIGKNYKKAFTNNVGLAKRLLKQKNIGHKLTGAYLAAMTPFETAVGGTALNLKSGYKGAKKMITGKDSAIRKKCTYKDYGVKGIKKGVRKAIKDSLIVMAYRKRQLRDAKAAYLKAKKRCLARRDSNLRRYRDSRTMLIIAKHHYQDALRRYQDSVLDTLKQKFKSVLEKIKKTVKEYIKAFPFLSSLTAGLMSMSSVGDAYGIVAGAPKILSTLEYQSKLIDQQDFSAYGKAGLKTRNVLLALYVVAKQIIKSIIKLKIAKGISETLKEK
jgi:hypothetical protein